MPAINPDKHENTLSCSKNTVTESNLPIYEGYTFFKADPIQGQDATWTRVERITMHLSQTEYFKMVQKRANKKSAAQQYQNISSNTRRAHINQLIDEQRRSNSLVEWSCVYAKEHAKPFKARNARRGDYETVSMDVIIMQRSVRTTYPRTPMGDLVDLGEAFRPSLWSRRRDHPSMQGQNGSMPRPILQGLQTQPATSSGQPGNPRQNLKTNPGERDEPRELTQSTATINVPSSPTFSATSAIDTNFEHTSGWSSEGSSDSDDESMLFDPSDESSETDSSDTTETKCREERRSMMGLLRQHAGSPLRRDSSYGPHYREKSHSRSLERRHERNVSLRDQFEAPTAQGFGPIRSGRARSRGSVSGKKYRVQLMNDNKIRSRLLDHREASIGHREKRLKRTFYEARQLELEQPVNDNPLVCRCTCRCAMEKREVD
jgi:hypothetical protein